MLADRGITAYIIKVSQNMFEETRSDLFKASKIILDMRFFTHEKETPHVKKKENPHNHV